MDTAREQRILKFSIGVTIAVSVVGFSGGLLVGSQAILFDGVYSLVDVALTLVSLSVLRWWRGNRARASSTATGTWSRWSRRWAV